jgi:hypothetical protein
MPAPRDIFGHSRVREVGGNNLWRSERYVLAIEGDHALASRQDVPAPIRHGSVRQQDERSLGRSVRLD